MNSKPYATAVRRAIEAGRPDEWPWYLPRNLEGWPPEYRRSAMHSIQARNGPGWSDAIRASSIMAAGRQFPDLDRTFYVNLEARP